VDGACAAQHDVHGVRKGTADDAESADIMNGYTEAMKPKRGEGLSLWQQRRVPAVGGLRLAGRVSGTWSRDRERLEQGFTRSQAGTGERDDGEVFDR
jgi:hypothetical protein